MIQKLIESTQNYMIKLDGKRVIREVYMLKVIYSIIFIELERLTISFDYSRLSQLLCGL